MTLINILTSLLNEERQNDLSICWSTTAWHKTNQRRTSSQVSFELTLTQNRAADNQTNDFSRNNSRIIRFVLSREKRRRRTNESSDHEHDEMHHHRQRAFRSFLSRDCVNHVLDLTNNLRCHLRCQLLWEDKKLSTSYVKSTESKIDDWFATEEIWSRDESTKDQSNL